MAAARQRCGPARRRGHDAGSGLAFDAAASGHMRSLMALQPTVELGPGQAFR
jgi:hypothetical protein